MTHSKLRSNYPYHLHALVNLPRPPCSNRATRQSLLHKHPCCLTSYPSLRCVGEAYVHLHALRSLMPFPFRQLALIVQLGIRDLARIPTAILFISEHRGPKALQVMACFGIHALHIPQKKILQPLLIGFLWMLVDSLASHSKNRARLESDRHRRPIVTEVVEEVSEVLCRRLRGLFALKNALW